jgi:enoyl-CoA hydratase/carnithine racemase
VDLISYTLDENVAVVSMDSGENRFNLPFFEAFHNALDEIEAKTKANVLVVKSSHEKIWSNGIDLDWYLPAVQNEGPAIKVRFGREMYGLFARIITYPMITVAAITGHAFAGGAIMSCAFDMRFMRSDRGWFCLPEVDIKIPFSLFFNAVLKKAIPLNILQEIQLTGKRMTAEECESQHIVTKSYHIDELMKEVLAYAKTLDKDREILKVIKARLYHDIVGVYHEQIQAMDEEPV